MLRGVVAETRICPDQLVVKAVAAESQPLQFVDADALDNKDGAAPDQASQGRALN
jgi:hypothetical protein